jgi:hypothetical protein
VIGAWENRISIFPWAAIIGGALTAVAITLLLVALGAGIGLSSVSPGCSSVTDGYSSAGVGGLFISYFTHSEVANATILLSIWCAARGRYTEALAFNGATFASVSRFCGRRQAPAVCQVHDTRRSSRGSVSGSARGASVAFLAIFFIGWMRERMT